MAHLQAVVGTRLGAPLALGLLCSAALVQAGGAPEPRAAGGAPPHPPGAAPAAGPAGALWRAGAPASIRPLSLLLLHEPGDPVAVSCVLRPAAAALAGHSVLLGSAHVQVGRACWLLAGVPAGGPLWSQRAVGVCRLWTGCLPSLTSRRV